jgi:hypothetical protein
MSKEDKEEEVEPLDVEHTGKKKGIVIEMFEVEEGEKENSDESVKEE